jgi:PIN domain nuclease of toxin-antitoxin system
MIVAVADTHAAIWYLFANPRLSSTARHYIDAAAQKREKVGISSISLTEMVYLEERGRIPADAYADLLSDLNDEEGVFVEIPVTQVIANEMRGVAREQVPDLPDRIIAATGLYLEVPIISRDGRIRASSLRTIW